MKSKTEADNDSFQYVGPSRDRHIKSQCLAVSTIVFDSLPLNNRMCQIDSYNGAGQVCLSPMPLVQTLTSANGSSGEGQPEQCAQSSIGAEDREPSESPHRFNPFWGI